ncbi:MAG: hypothetical protein CSYNP_01010 [Syntrophus sp. SKADARSKE-3]|nr:hypothetical protein [Syntrophus sp. SKADARSKE-3]
MKFQMMKVVALTLLIILIISPTFKIHAAPLSLGKEAQIVDIKALDDGNIKLAMNKLQATNIYKKSNAYLIGNNCKNGPGTSIIIIPLIDQKDQDKQLYMYYMKDKNEYFFMDISPNKSGQNEAKIYGKGDSVIVISQDQIEAKTKSEVQFTDLSQVIVPDMTLRKTPHATLDDRASRNFGSESTDVSDILACIGKTLGIDITIGSLKDILSTGLCSATKVFGTVQTALHCISCFSLGAANVSSTIGCIVGIARLISCGYVNCSNLDSN